MKLQPIPRITPFFSGELRQSNTFQPPVKDGGVEVVMLAEHEKVVDHLREQRDSFEGELEGVRRLLDAAPNESVTAAAMKVRRQREHETERIRHAEVVDGPGIDRGRELCHAHAAYSPEGDCFVCDAAQERERAEKAEGALVLRAFHAPTAGPIENIESLAAWTELDPERIEQALERLEDDEKVQATYGGRDRPHWELAPRKEN